MFPFLLIAASASLTVQEGDDRLVEHPPVSWSLTEGRDPITDLPTASASSRSESGKDRIVVRCDGVGEPVLSVQFISDRYLGGSDERNVTLRFNDLAAIDSLWEYTTKGAFNRNRRTVGSTAALLSQDGQLRVRAWRYDDQPIDAHFILKGGAEKIAKVFNACGYPVPVPGRP